MKARTHESTQCFIDVVNVLCARIYIPDEIVALVGEKGMEMYFLVRGECEVCGQHYFSTLCYLAVNASCQTQSTFISVHLLACLCACVPVCLCACFRGACVCVRDRPPTCPPMSVRACMPACLHSCMQTSLYACLRPCVHGCMCYVRVC